MRFKQRTLARYLRRYRRKATICLAALLWGWLCLQPASSSGQQYLAGGSRVEPITCVDDGLVPVHGWSVECSLGRVAFQRLYHAVSELPFIWRDDDSGMEANWALP